MRTVLFLAVLILSPLAALAAGSGGGGGMSSPSSSAPNYDPAAEYRRGIDALETKDYKAARKAFDRVLAVAPKDGNSNYLAGVARLGLDDLKGAARKFERATKYSPDLVRGWRDLGVTYARLGKRPKAESTLAKLEQRAAKCGAGCALEADFGEAIGAIKSALAAPPSAFRLPTDALQFANAEAGDARYLAAVESINEGRYEDAITELERAQQAFGPHPDVLTYIGFSHRKLGRLEQAETYYRRALAAAPAHRGATEYFGELMVERGDLSGARRMLAVLDAQCRFGCAEAEELRAWIAAGRSPHS